MTQPELAAATGVNVKTIVNFETESRATTPAVQAVIKLALESADVIFIEENGDGPGGRLRKRQPSASACAAAAGPPREG